jgi:hypothetical protein
VSERRGGREAMTAMRAGAPRPSRVLCAGKPVSLCVTVCHCVSLCVTVYHCVSLCVTVRLQR